jgi:predicted RNA-binding Zn ribbon-like protein
MTTHVATRCHCAVAVGHHGQGRIGGARRTYGVILGTGSRPLHLTSPQLGNGVDLNSYAELAVRLVNTASGGGEDGDRLVNLDGLRALVADREHLNTGMTRNDLDALRALREEFRVFFEACAAGDGDDAAAQLNALLIQHPVHPQLSGHDGQPWHVHYTESGSVADKYAAGAVMGLAVRLTDLGIDRFGVCQAATCRGVFVDVSTSNTRRYCSDRCMNRANVSAFRARKRGEDDTDPKAPTATR